MINAYIGALQAAAEHDPVSRHRTRPRSSLAGATAVPGACNRIYITPTLRVITRHRRTEAGIQIGYACPPRHPKSRHGRISCRESC